MRQLIREQKSNQHAARRGPRGILSVAAAALLVASGVGYRLLAGRIEAGPYLPPRGSPDSVPCALGAWRGQNVPLDERVLRQPAIDDEYVNRVYVNTSDGQVVTLYVGYIGRAHRWLPHRPDICYPAHGMRQSFETQVMVTRPSGDPVPCLLQEFDSADPMKPDVLVLSTYVVNGRYSNDKHLRNATLFADRPPFIMRIQLGTPLNRDRDDSSPALRDLLGRLIDRLGTIVPYMED